MLHPDPAARLSAVDALAHSWLRGKTPCTEPLLDGHADRLVAYQRLQHLRANILAVVMSTQHSRFETTAGSARAAAGSPVPRTTTVNMDMFRDTFALFDKDESGFIDHDELEGVLRALGQRLSRYVLPSCLASSSRIFICSCYSHSCNSTDCDDWADCGHWLTCLWLACLGDAPVRSSMRSCGKQTWTATARSRSSSL